MSQKTTLLVALSCCQEVDALLAVANALTDSTRFEMVVLGLVAVPSGAPLSDGTIRARRLRQAINLKRRDTGAPVSVRVAHHIWDELKKIVIADKPAILMLSSTNLPSFEWLHNLPCQVIVVKPSSARTYPRILYPIRGGHHAALALRTALSLADSQQGQVTALHSTSAQNGNKYYDRLIKNLRLLPQITRWIKTRGNVVNAIVRAAREHDVVVLGATMLPQPDEPAIGNLPARILNRIKIPALVVRTPPPLPFFQSNHIEAQPVDHTISVVVDKWFAENTFHASEFQDLERLIRLKHDQKLTLSLGLPALNEEKTIGKVIKTIRAKLQDEVPFLDEIVVIDSDSTDRTVQIAQDLGVPVVKHSQVLPNQSARTGKGEALWKSLTVLRGDLIAWIDTDIENIHPRFVYGILGPLIRNPNLVFVKGFYQRPLRMGKKIQARGGGRVTELVARPLLNLFYPELAGLVQPLAGEYAGRRAALERIPFFSGYGVETGMLIDLHAQYGLNAIGQVDLEERVHHNQSMGALSKMAFEIIQVVMQRIGQTHDLHLVDDLNKSIKLIQHNRSGFQLEVADIRARERPPMITIPEYRARYAASPVLPKRLELPVYAREPLKPAMQWIESGASYAIPESAC